MIDTAIEKYDEKQERRHDANLQRLDSLNTNLNDMNTKMNRIIGGLLLLGALIPVAAHFWR